ncbi:NCS2 family permease [Planctomycetota bacterium]
MVRDYFKLAERQTNVRVEVMAGLTTFLTMAYIIFANPNILSGGAGMDKQAVIVATCLAAAIGTILVGLVANAPIAMAPGMGLNAFFAALVATGKMAWPTALGAVFVSGAVFLLLTAVGLRKWLVAAIPDALVSAIAVGIGLFIAFMGLVDLGLVVNNEFTLVSAGELTPSVLMGLAGLLLMIVFEMLKIKGGLLAGILLTTVLGAIFDPSVTLPERWVALEIDIRPVAFKLDIFGALKWGLVGSVFSLMFVDLFDSMGTLVACCHQAKMTDENGRVRGLDRLLAVDAAATMVGALLGTSTTTSYIESAAGIEQGGRTGLTALVTGMLFLAALALTPLIGVVPSYATAPALIMVGLFMMKEIHRIDFNKFGESFPAFIIVVMIALSYSISIGLAFGFISYVVIQVVSGRFYRVKLAMWVIAVLSLAFLIVDKCPGAVDAIRQWLEQSDANLPSV